MPGAIGPSVDLYKKAEHHNMVAPSLGRFSLGRSRESNLLSVNHRHKNPARVSDSK